MYKSCQREHRSGNQLYQKLLTIANPYQIIRNTHNEQQGQPRAHKQNLYPMPRYVHQGDPSCHITDPYQKSASKQDNGEKRNSTQPRYRSFVHLPCVRSIKQTFTKRND